MLARPSLASLWTLGIGLAAAAMAATAVAEPRGGVEAKKSAFQWIEEQKPQLFALNRLIWEAAEVGLEERRSSAALAAYLEENGFTVQRGVAEMPTAFIASFGSGSPVIAILAEFDALPGMSQEAVAERRPRAEGGAGHACGHSVFGSACVAGAAAARRAMESLGLKGTLRVYGTPAEETGIGKSYMAKAGLFADCDAALHWHPGHSTNVTYSSSKAVVSVKYTFDGLPAHASLSPHDGRSALDAVELMNLGANLLREHIKEDARIHYVITDGGGQPNVVPGRAQVWYYLRANDHDDVERLFHRVGKIAEGAALMTETQVRAQIDSDVHEIIPNRPLSELLQRNLELVGPPRFDEAEREFARKTQVPLLSGGVRGLDKPLADGIEALTAEPDLVKASTDVGDVSWMVPTGGFRAACYTYGAPGHSWQVVACTGMSIGEKGLLVAAKTLAASAIELIADPRQVEAAREDFRKRIRDKKYTSLVPEGQKAPERIR
jgi:aminobenzoyl-glutamate utilization protein B